MKSLGYSYIEQNRKELNDIAQFLHKNPELCFKEYKSHDYITNFLEKYEFEVERKFLYDTGFRATFKTGETPHIVILVEYDALPKIGQACGHNIIAQSSVATAIGLKEVISKGNLKCKISVLGTPAEEGGGGKIKFIENGIFKDVDVAIMSHPFTYEMVYLPFLAIVGYRIRFIGKEVHASVIPWEGINALDAAVMTYQSISCLRQQMHPNCRVHGIFTKGGEAPNIIPKEAELQYFIRAPTRAMVIELGAKIRNCCHGSALATGCQVEIDEEDTPLYTDLIKNEAFNEVFIKNSVEIQNEHFCNLLPLQFDQEPKSRPELLNITGSSDAGNVSYEVPTIHPMFNIGTKAQNHTEDFATCAGTEEAWAYGIRQSKIMLGTLIDIIQDEKLLSKIKDEFNERIKKL